MTPAIEVARKAGVLFSVHEYCHDPKSVSFGLEAAENLGVPPETIFKTLVVQSEKKELAVAIVPVLKTLDLKATASALGAKKAQMADKLLVQRTTGYVLGGVSPLGQKKPLPTLIDNSAIEHLNIFVSGGRRGLDISISSQDLAALCQATFAKISR
ncbi:MAG: Cys-tRNA(Pro) deacylase [bacterium]